MFFAQPVAALTAIRRALRPGARFAASTVGPPDRNPMVGTVVAAILDALDLELPPLPAPGEPGFYSFSNGEVLEAAFAAAGFDEVDVEPFEIEYKYSSGGQLADWQFAISAPVNALLGQRPERRQEAWDAVAAAAEPCRASNGLIRFPPSANWYAAGSNTG
jgi:hypothetical protein